MTDTLLLRLQRFSTQARPPCGAKKKQLEGQGDLKDKPRGRYFKKIDPQKLEEYLAAYLYEIGAVFGCSSVAVLKALKRMGYTNKKKIPLTKSRRGRKSWNLCAVRGRYGRQAV